MKNSEKAAKGVVLEIVLKMAVERWQVTRAHARFFTFLLFLFFYFLFFPSFLCSVIVIVVVDKAKGGVECK